MFIDMKDERATVKMSDIDWWTDIIDNLREENETLKEKYLELRKEHRRLEKEHNKLQVEHSRILFDIDAVIEGEVKKKYKNLTEKCKNLETRIDVMQELIDYNEWIVQNALRDMEIWDNDKAFDYMQECYALWDEAMYEAMERADEEDSDLYD